MTPENEDIIKAELIANEIDLCKGGCQHRRSHSRGFAVPDQRTIHYSKKCMTRSTLYGFLHEIGHIVMGHGKKNPLRSHQKEFQAEQYARRSFREYGITVPRKQVVMGNAYVARRKAFGDAIKRGRA